MMSALTKDCRPPLSELVGRHVPYLRRYARALIGSQAEGDQAVAGMIVALRGDPALLPAGPATKASLFRLFHKAWDGDGLPPVSRRFLLLTMLEGFGQAEAAGILDIDPNEVDALVAEARRDLAQFVRARIAIIEDEPAIALDLEQLVLDLGHHVTGSADTHGRAVELIRRTRPDLVLADIQLADGSSGIDAIDEISASYPVPVIFITAYPERLLTGERAEPTYLIAKPYVDEVVRTTIALTLFNHSPKKTLELV